MTEIINTYFEIFDTANLIRVEPIKSYDGDSQLDWDRNWIRTKVIIKGGAFNGKYDADFMTTDFELLKRDIKNLDKNFSGIAKFEPLEGQLKLLIVGDGLGHFKVDCTATEDSSLGSTLNFSLTFDQTELSRLINELDKITKAFPITGDMKIKNE
jgi:hypothetical protein